MLKKTLKFEDFNGNPVEKDWYFNMTKFEANRYDASHKGGIIAYLNSIVAQEDGEKLFAAIEELVMLCVGARSADGRQFLKTEEIKNEFRYSGAFDAMLMEMLEDPQSIQPFLEGVLPKVPKGSAAPVPASK